MPGVSQELSESSTSSFGSEVIGTELQICVDCSEVLGAKLTSVEDVEDEFWVGKYLVMTNAKAGSQLERLIGHQEESVMRVLFVNGRTVSDITEYKQAVGDDSQQCYQLSLLYPGVVNCSNIDKTNITYLPFTWKSIEKLHGNSFREAQVLSPESTKTSREPKDLFALKAHTAKTSLREKFRGCHSSISALHPSILITGQSNKERYASKTKTVTFWDDVIEEQQYSPSNAAIEHHDSDEPMLDSPAQLTGPPKQIQPTEPPQQINALKPQQIQPTEPPQQINALKKAIRDGTSLEVVKTLMQNDNRKLLLVKNLKKLREVIKDLILRSTGTKRQDFIMKDKLLKIFINFAHIVRQARYMNSWEQFEIQLNRIEGLHFKDAVLCNLDGCRISGKVFAMQETVNKLHDIPPLPLIFDQDTSSYLIYFDPKVTYNMNHNAVLCDDRTLMLDLQLNGGKMPIQLGSVSVKLSLLHTKCPSDKSWKQVVIPANPSNMMSGALCMCARQVPMDHAALDGRRISLLMEIKKIKDWIYQWNQDIAESDSGKMNLGALPTNIKDEDDISMLHVAVFLEDFDMIEKLLQEGADPDVKSSVGSPETLATEIAKGIKEEVLRNKQPAEKHADAQVEQARYENITKIIELFKNHSYNNNLAESRSEEDFWDNGKFDYPSLN